MLFYLYNCLFSNITYLKCSLFTFILDLNKPIDTNYLPELALVIFSFKQTNQNQNRNLCFSVTYSLTRKNKNNELLLKRNLGFCWREEPKFNEFISAIKSKKVSGLLNKVFGP